MTTAPEHSGADLARIALQAARKAAKTRPTDHGPRQRRRPTRRRGTGRDPLALGAAIGQLMDERAWETPTAGADIVADWPTIAPELVGKVAAERFDPERGVLCLRPASPAARAHLTLFQQQMIRRINDKTGRQVVRALRILPPGNLPATPAPAFTAVKPTPSAVEPADPAPPHPAYRQAREAVRTAQQNHAAGDAADRELRDRYFAGHRGTLREPDPAFADAVTALEDAQTTKAKETTRQAAINAARAQRAGRYPTTPRPLGGAA